MTADQIQNQIVPRHRGARRDQILALSRDNQHALGMDPHLRIGGREFLRVAEMHRRIDTVEQSRLCEQEDA